MVGREARFGLGRRHPELEVIAAGPDPAESVFYGRDDARGVDHDVEAAFVVELVRAPDDLRGAEVPGHLAAPLVGLDDGNGYRAHPSGQGDQQEPHGAGAVDEEAVAQLGP